MEPSKTIPGASSAAPDPSQTMTDCEECKGNGQCPDCSDGSGVPDPDCAECSGSGVCPYCGGEA